MTDLHFVPATEQDRAFFIRVHHEAYHPTIERMFAWDDGYQDNAAAKAFDDGGIHIVWRGGDKVGVVGWKERPDCLWMKEVFVLPEHQRQGVGGRIVERSIAMARRLGKELRLRTLKANFGAKRLYERHGFVVTEATDVHWCMTRPLD